MTYYELSDALNRCGAAAQEAGVSCDNLVKLITLLNKRTERSGAIIGNSLKTLFTRLYSQKTTMLLGWEGIPTFYKNGRPKPALTILKTLSRKFPFIENDLYEEMGGVYQVTLIKILIKNLWQKKNKKKK